MDLSLCLVGNLISLHPRHPSVSNHGLPIFQTFASSFTLLNFYKKEKGLSSSEERLNTGIRTLVTIATQLRDLFNAQCLISTVLFDPLIVFLEEHFY